MITCKYKLEKVKLSLSLYKNKYIHRDGVIKLINTFNNFISYHDNYIQEEICKDLSDVDSAILNRIKLSYFRCKNALDDISTEEKCFSLYKELGIFIEPTIYLIGLEEVLNKNGETIEQPVYGVHLSLQNQLETFFQIPGLYEQFLLYEEYLFNDFHKTGIVSNVIQTPTWDKYKKKYQGLNIVPIFGFFDDFTTGNALGSHSDSKKLGGVYISLPSLPPHLRAKLNNIFVASIFYSKHKAVGGNQGVFKEFIKDVNHLAQTGITISHKNQKIRLHFFLVLMLGDNLGMNQACGFKCSGGKYFCRICRMPSYLTQITPIEHPKFLRNVDNYKSDLKNLSHGVVEECVFNQVIDFHIAEKYSLDIMHDDLEGTAPVVIVNVLNFLIYDEKIISLEKINSRIATFNYGIIEKKNKPRLLTEESCAENVSGAKKTVVCKQSAAEMLCLIRYLGLMIGDLIPPNNKFWKMYRTLRQKVGLTMAPSFRECDLFKLDDIIARQNKDFIENFKDMMHKPHNETHLTRVMRLFGPAVHFWSMTFERKNRDLKIVGAGTNCNKNLPYSIAIRNQLHMSWLKLNCECVESYFTLGPVEDESESVTKEFRALNNNIQGNLYCKTLRFVKFFGKKLTTGSVIVTTIDDHGPSFGIIIKIYQAKHNVYLFIKNLVLVVFDSYYHAYEVVKLPEQESKKQLIHIDLIPKIEPCLLVEKPDIGKTFVATRSDL